MGTFANPETLFDNSTNGPTVEQALQQMRDNQRAIMELEGAKPTEVCTISTTNINTNGTIYPSCAEVVVALPENTNGLSAILTDISPSYERTTGVYEMLHDGMVVSLKSEFSSYQIELVSSETLRLKTAERITLSHLYPLKLKLVLGNNGDYYWEEVPSAGTHSGDITSISGDLDVSGKIRSNGALLEKKLMFDSTPVYDVTLTEDITNVKIATPYIIPFNSADNIQKIRMLLKLPAVDAQDYYRVDFVFDNDSSKKTQTSFSYGTVRRTAVIDVENNSGMAQSFYMFGNVGTYTSLSRYVYYPGEYSPVFLFPSSKITEIQIYGASGGANMYTLKAGTRIIAYAAKEAE